MMRTTILFDLDDTLIDRKASIRRYAEMILRDFSSDLSNNDPEALAKIVISSDQGGYIPRPAVSAELTQTLPWKKPPSADVLLSHWMAHFPQASCIRAHAREVLQQLRDHEMTIGMVTNGSTIGQNRKIDILELRPYFSSIVISETVGIKKPAPAIFEIALSQLGKQPEEAWFVGDNPRNDIIGAASFGLSPIWLSGSHPWPKGEPPPANQITSMDEIPALIL